MSARELELLRALEAVEHELTAARRTGGRRRTERIERALAIARAALESKGRPA